VSVMSDGIHGWKSAGKPVDYPKKTDSDSKND
jgi:hypothetical protein